MSKPDRNYEDEPSAKEAEAGRPRWKEFDCPDCSANNPHDEPFSEGEEIRCFYCGAEFKVVAHGEKFKLKSS